jgi:hypothetical protein
MRRLRSAAVLTVTTVLLAGCASTTGGTGRGSAPPPDPSPTTQPPTTSNAATPSLAPPSRPSTASSAPTSATATNGPAAVDPPHVCIGGGCTKLKSVDLGDGYAVTLYTGAGAGGEVASAVLELALNDVPVFWNVTDEAIAGELECSPRPRPNCVVVLGVGAHASVATGYTLDLNKLVKYGEVSSDTPSTDPVDLNGDGLVDVVTTINTYEPSYATGTVYWQTYQSTGSAFASTGCTTAAHTLPPEPTAPLTGTCPR